MAADDLQSLTVNQLKEQLKEAGLAVSGKKEELVQRLKAHKDKQVGEASSEAPKEKEAEKKEDADESKQEEAVEEVKGEEPENKDVEMKTEEGVKEDVKEEAQEPKIEEAKELEEDAPTDKRAKVAASSANLGQTPKDCTMNVMTTSEGKVLTALSDGGLHHLVASARSSVGIEAGRYMFEVRIVESKSFADAGKSKAKQSCCLGFTSADSSLFLSDGSDCVGFDSEGFYRCGGEWSQKALYNRFEPYTAVYGVLLNLDQKSPNANTVSLFCNGTRVCQPQALPESLKGKPLYPTVNYKGMTLHVNMGPSCVAPLPFTCRMVQDAAAEDVVVSAKPVEAKADVMIPVGLPDEGTFEWLDGFLKENPQYTELSNRALLKWALKSGHYQGRNSDWSSCNDEPTMNFGIRELDDYSLMKTIYTFAPMLKRPYVVMEVKNNLLAEERRKALDLFPEDTFKKSAMIVVGEPPEEFKAKAHQQILEEKRKSVASEVRCQKTMEAAQKRQEKREKEEKERAEKKEEDKEEGDNKEEKKEEEEPEEEGETIEEAIKKATDAVELLDSEKGTWFPKPTIEDLTKKDLGNMFSSFSLPEKSEGFDDVKYAWQKDAKAVEYLKSWVSERKLTQRVEDLTPGDRFREQQAEWSRVVQEWRKRGSDFRDASRRKEVEKRKKPEGEKEEKAEKENEHVEEGDTKEGEEDVVMEDTKTSSENVDPCTVEDINDIGKGEPLYANFTWEDWTMLNLRFELHLLVHSYRLDVDDVERPSFQESHLNYYYNKYFKRPFQSKQFGFDENIDVLKVIKDTIEVMPKNSVLDPQLSEDTPLDNFVRLTEDHRRERQLRIDAGDEAAALNLQRPPPRNQQQQGGNWGGRGDHGKGRDGHRNARGGDYSSRQQSQSQSYGTGNRDDGYNRSRAPPPPAAIGQPSSRSDNRGGGRDQGRSGGGRDARGSSGGGGGYNSGGYSRDSGFSQRSSGGSGGGQGVRDSYSSRDAGGGGGYQRDSRGAPPSRHRSPPSSRGPPPPAPSHGGQKRGYAPPSSSGGGNYGSGQSYSKQPRTSSYTGGAPPAPSRGGGSFGSSGGSYRRG